MVSRRDRNFEVHYFAARRQLLTLENNERTERNGTENRDFCTFFFCIYYLAALYSLMIVHTNNKRENFSSSQNNSQTKMNVLPSAGNTP